MKEKIKNNLNIIITSILISIAINIEILMKNNPNTIRFLSNINYFFLFIKFILIGSLSFLILKFLVKRIEKINLSTSNYQDKQIKKIFLISFITLFVVWIISYLTFFPGGADYDTFYQLTSPGAASSQHPIGYSYLLNIFTIKIGYNILGNGIIGFGIFTFLQMLFIIFTLSYTLAFLAKRKVSPILLSIILGIYAFTPIYASYSIFAVKDVLFASLLIYLFLLLTKIIETKGAYLSNKKFIIYYIILNTTMFLTRSNAFVIYIITSIILIIRYKKYFNKKMLILLLVPFIINTSANKIIQKRYNVKHYFQESMAIPLQQISAVVANNGNLSRGEKDLISHLLSFEEIKKSYNHGTVDPIKWHKDFDREYLQINKLRFLKNWGTILLKNLDIYIESYAYQTESFWSIGLITDGHNMYYDVFSNTTDTYVETQKERYNLFQKDLFPNSIEEKLENFYYKYSQYLYPGTCIWLIIISMLLSSYKNKEYTLLYIPYLAMWISMMCATPLSFSLRYMFPFILIFPILLSVPLMIKERS